MTKTERIARLYAAWLLIYGDATFEFYNPAPWVMRIKPGDRLVQLVLMTMEKVPERSYSITGKYNGQTGPTPHKKEVK